MSSTTLPTRPPRPTVPERRWRRTLAVAAGGSAVLALAGGWMLAHPASNPLADPAAALARAVLGTTGVTLVLVGLGLVGLAAALLALTRPATDGTRPALLAVAGFQVVGLATLQSVTTMSLAGYLLALALPVGLVVLAVQLVRRYRRLRWLVVAALALVAVWGSVTSTLRLGHLLNLAGEIGAGFVRNAGQLGLTVLVGAVTAAWLLVGLAGLRERPSSGLSAWVLRHRTALTLLAAAGPLPYGVARASWLTPWPLLAPGGEVLGPEVRLWGLLLGGGAVLGAVLTVGLIRPWGVVFPGWMPGWAGRPVPVRAATVPGGLVAGAVCASALPMLRMTLTPQPDEVFGGTSVLVRLAGTLVFPFWIWGPSLALAVWGYALSRRAALSPAPPVPAPRSSGSQPDPA